MKTYYQIVMIVLALAFSVLLTYGLCTGLSAIYKKQPQFPEQLNGVYGMIYWDDAGVLSVVPGEGIVEVRVCITENCTYHWVPKEFE